MGHPLNVLKGTRRKVEWIAHRADWVIAGSEVLAEHISRLNDRTTVVPSLVDPAAYSLRRHVEVDITTLGWIGSPTTAPFLSAAAKVLEIFARQSPRPVRLLVVGGRAPRISGIEVVERAWTPEAERQALAEMDIGLMPLPDTAWSRGKCAYKALQYMASGIPPLVDDVGVSASVVTGAGWIASDEAGWLEGLHSLASDPQLRLRLGAAGRTRVEREFSVARWLPTLTRILRGS
jgi:glycosyltransferase involved in cell wall biosynthesis